MAASWSRRTFLAAAAGAAATIATRRTARGRRRRSLRRVQRRHAKLHAARLQGRSGAGRNQEPGPAQRRAVRRPFQLEVVRRRHRGHEEQDRPAWASRSWGTASTRSPRITRPTAAGSSSPRRPASATSRPIRPKTPSTASTSCARNTRFASRSTITARARATTRSPTCSPPSRAIIR